jgi:cytochrome P450 family 4
MRRHLLTPSFHFQILYTFIEVFNKQSLILCDVLDKRRQSQQEDDIINVYPFVANCTLDIICGKLYFLEMAIILFKNIWLWNVILEAAMGVSVNAQYQRSEYVKAIYR